MSTECTHEHNAYIFGFESFLSWSVSQYIAWKRYFQLPDPTVSEARQQYELFLHMNMKLVSYSKHVLHF